MGCFLTNGFISHLPICADDPIYAILCIKPHTNLVHEYLIPIYLPIKGKYDEYGQIYQVEYTPEVKLLEELAGFKIDRIIDLVYMSYRNAEYESEFHNEVDKDDFEKFRDNIKLNDYEFRFDHKKFDFCFTLEHCDVIDTLSEIRLKQVNASYDCAIDNIHILDVYYKYKFNRPLEIPDPDNPDKLIYTWRVIDDVTQDYLQTFYKIGDSYDGYMNVNPDFREGYFGRWRSEASGFRLLFVFKLKEKEWMNPEFRESYCRFLSLYMTMFRMGLNFTMSQWQGQEPEPTMHKKLVASYNRVLKAQSSKRKSRW